MLFEAVFGQKGFSPTAEDRLFGDHLARNASSSCRRKQKQAAEQKDGFKAFARIPIPNLAAVS